jgi:hypothetical protein
LVQRGGQGEQEQGAAGVGAEDGGAAWEPVDDPAAECEGGQLGQDPH